MKSILEYCPPGTSLRPVQITALLDIEAALTQHDVVVGSYDVGSGKSLIARVVAAWAADHDRSTGILTHRVSLQDQYERSFPDVPTLRGVGRYTCSRYQMNCAEVKETVGEYCGGGCSYLAARNATKASKVAVFNYHTYLFNYTDRRDWLVVDEAHALFEILAEQYAISCWKHKESYPDNLRTCGEVAIWLETRLRVIRSESEDVKQQIAIHMQEARSRALKDEVVQPPADLVKELKVLQETVQRYERILNGLQTAPANFFIEHSTDFYRGKEMPLLRVRPTTLRGLPPLLWSNGNRKQKLILLSGTIREEDVSKLGLQGMRVKYLEGENPIPASQRPVDASFGLNMSFKYQDKNLPGMAQKIRELATKHSDTKGLCHLTYDLSRKLQPLLTGPRYIWHTNKDSAQKLKQFLDSKEPVIFMACGMEEGLDLAGPEYGWQAIIKIPWPSRADKLIDKFYREDMPWVLWMTVRKLRQMTGRICRGPTDFGVTYILDSGLGNPKKRRWGLMNQCQKLFGKSFLDSVKW